MKTYILTARVDSETGELGYCLDCLPQFDGMPMVTDEGRLIAHDLLEHQNGPENIGTIADELQALGAVWFIRGQFDDLSRNNRGSMYTPIENLASDIARQARDYCYNDESLPMLDYDIESDDNADNWRDMVNYAQEHNDCDDDEKIEHADTLREFFALVPALLAEGWKKAAARYESAYHANNLFWEIATALDPYMKPEWEGQQMSLTFDEGDTASVVVDPEHYEYGDDELECDECCDVFAAGSGGRVSINGYTWCPDCWAQEQEG